MSRAEELRASFNEVEGNMNAARSCAKVGVAFAAGKLKSLYLDAETLRSLKRELQGFDAKRGRWTH